MISSNISAGPVTGGSYTWTPAKDIPNGNEYFYEIYQDVLNSAQSGTLIYSGGAAPSAAIPTSLTATGSSTSTLRTHKTTQTTLSKAAATSVVVSVVTSIPTSSPTSVTSPQPESSPPIAAVAVGASIAAAFFLVLAGIGFFFYRRRRRSRRTPEDDYHDNHSTTELVQKHPEVSSNSEIFEIRADRDVRELGTGGALGWLPSGGSRQELPSPISPMYRHELPTEESLCELEGSVVGDYDKSREAVGKGHDRPSEETETSSNRDRGSTGSGRRITLR